MQELRLSAPWWSTAGWAFWGTEHHPPVGTIAARLTRNPAARRACRRACAAGPPAGWARALSGPGRPRTPPPLRVTAGRLIPSGTEASQLPLLLLKTWSTPRCTLHCTIHHIQRARSGQRTAMLSEPQRQEPLPDSLVVDSLDLYTAVEECHWAGAQALKFLAQRSSVACKLTDNRHLP